jgi:hypothetical protein
MPLASKSLALALFEAMRLLFLISFDHLLVAAKCRA